MHDYLWGLSAPMIRMMMSDATEVIYLDDEQSKEYKQWKRTGRRKNYVTDNPDEFAAELGIPTFD